MANLEQLMAVVARLRAPDGCPWDREQTPLTACRFVLEEAYEVVDALEHGTADDVREELGDLLFNIVLLAQMYEEHGSFSMKDVVADIHDKMIRRHPHVFADAPRDRASIRETWQRIKAKERPRSESALDGIPRASPPLQRAFELGRAASGLGFDWSSVEGPRRKLDEEVAELDEALATQPQDANAVQHELGDVLFTVVNLCRHLRSPSGETLRPDAALRSANYRFEQRFRRTEQLARERGVDMGHAGEQVLDALWEAAKAELATQQNGVTS